MANGFDEEQMGTSGVPRIGTQGNVREMRDRRFARQIKDIASDRGLSGTQRRAATALAAAERNAPRSATAVNRPVVTQAQRLLQEAVDNPRLRGSGRRALISGAAELSGRSDIAEDLTFGRGLRSVRVRPSRAQVSAEVDPFDEAVSTIRGLQRQGLRRPLRSRVSRFNEASPLESGEETFQDDLLSYEGLF